MKTIDALISKTLVELLDKLRMLEVTKEDIVNVFQNAEGNYIAIFYS